MRQSLLEEAGKVWQKRQCTACMKLLMGLDLNRHIHPLPATPRITVGALPRLCSYKTSQIHGQILFSLFLAKVGSSCTGISKIAANLCWCN